MRPVFVGGTKGPSVAAGAVPLLRRAADGVGAHMQLLHPQLLPRQIPGRAGPLPGSCERGWESGERGAAVDLNLSQREDEPVGREEINFVSLVAEAVGSDSPEREQLSHQRQMRLRT